MEYLELVVGVKLDEKYSDCGNWKVKGIPYLHALACLNYIKNDKLESYTDPYFHTKTWKKCYQGSYILLSLKS